MSKPNPAILTAVVATFVEEIVREVHAPETEVALGTIVVVELKVPYKELRKALGITRVTRETKDALLSEVSKYPYIEMGNTDKYILFRYRQTVIETITLHYKHDD